MSRYCLAAATSVTAGAAPAEPVAFEGHAPARLEPQRYRVQFTASEEYVKLVDEAKALLAHASPRIGLDELHLRALRVLVDKLKKQKYAASRSGSSIPPLSSESPQPTKRDLDAAEQPQSSRQSERYIPAALRRAVFERDAGRCTYVGTSGERCQETHGLELHHLRAFALGGQHSEENLTLRCRSHNALAAEEELGREFVHRRRDSLEHEPFGRQRLLE